VPDRDAEWRVDRWVRDFIVEVQLVGRSVVADWQHELIVQHIERQHVDRRIQLVVVGRRRRRDDDHVVLEQLVNWCGRRRVEFVLDDRLIELIDDQRVELVVHRPAGLCPRSDQPGPMPPAVGPPAKSREGSERTMKLKVVIVDLELSTRAKKRLLRGSILAALLLGGATLAYADWTVPVNFQPNTALRAADLNNNFAALADAGASLEVRVAALEAAQAKETADGGYALGAIYCGFTTNVIRRQPRGGSTVREQRLRGRADALPDWRDRVQRVGHGAHVRRR
jgi:hypothetical protein